MLLVSILRLCDQRRPEGLVEADGRLIRDAQYFILWSMRCAATIVSSSGGWGEARLAARNFMADGIGCGGSLPIPGVLGDHQEGKRPN